MKTNNLKKSKKGDERLMGIPWILCLVIVTIGIAAGTLGFYGASINVNEIEAEILHNKIIDCITDNGVLKDSFLMNDFSNIYSLCNLNKDLFETTGSYFLELELRSKSEVISSFSSEKKSLKEECKIQQAVKKAEHYPRCFIQNQKILYYQKDKQKQGILKIITVSDNEGIKTKS